jgi:DNA-binding beta-propeller fold protein YncE
MIRFDIGRLRGEILLGLMVLMGLMLTLLAAPAGAQEATAEVLETPAESPEHTTLVYPPFSHTLGIHRARSMHLKLFLGNRTEFDDPQGAAAVKFAADDDPDVKSDDFQLTLFGVNAGRGEILFNSSMQTLAIYGRAGSGQGMFRSPRGIAAHPDGRVYVADTGNRRVARLRWDAAGRRLTWVGSWPAQAPFDVAVDHRGNAFVADREADAVLRFSDSTAGTGSGLAAPSPVTGDRWPLPDDVDDPVGLVVGDSLDAWYAPHHYRLVLVDQGGARMRVYDAEGRVLAETTPQAVATAAIPQPGPAGRFSYVALDFHGNVYVTDPVRGVVVKLDPALALLAVFPGTGESATAFEEPRGIAIWRRFGQVFVAEREGAQYFFVGTDFRPTEGPLTVARSETGWGFEIFLTEASHVKAAFLDAAGDTLAVAAPQRAFTTGEQAVKWDASGWQGGPAPGWEERATTIVVEARPTYSSRRKFARVRSFPVEWADGT